MKTYKIVKIAIITVMMIGTLSCKDIFDKDITARSVEVVAPADKAEAPEGEVTFLWKPVSYATGYHLTIVSPSFEHAAILIADTVMMNDTLGVKLRYRHLMPAGEYQWNIRALNSSYTTRDNISHLNIFAPGGNEENRDDDPDVEG